MCSGPRIHMLVNWFAWYFRIVWKVAVAICENKMKADKKLIIYPLLFPTPTLLLSGVGKKYIFIKSILINMHAAPWEVHKSMGALLITPRWGRAEGNQNERPRNFRLVYRKLSGINMHERTLGNEIEMKSWRAEKRNSLHGRSYPRRESCLLSCRVVGKYEGYLIGAHAIYIPTAYMPNRKKVYD